jgi:hypothetical protein
MSVFNANITINEGSVSQEKLSNIKQDYETIFKREGVQDLY